MPPRPTIGRMRHRVDLETALAQPISIAELTAIDGVATAQTAVPHGYEDGEEIEVAGASDPAYNGRFPVTVSAADAFTYPVVGAAITPASGTMTATYISDGAGGRREAWRTKAANLAAEVTPLSGYERLQVARVAASLAYRVRIWYRDDVTEQDRWRWDGRILQIVAPPVRMDGDKVFLETDCAESR